MPEGDCAPARPADLLLHAALLFLPGDAARAAAEALQASRGMVISHSITHRMQSFNSIMNNQQACGTHAGLQHPP